MDEAEAVEAPLPEADFLEQLTQARRGLRSCFRCRHAFPNGLALVKHQLHGCPKAK